MGDREAAERGELELPERVCLPSRFSMQVPPPAAVALQRKSEGKLLRARSNWQLPAAVSSHQRQRL